MIGLDASGTKAVGHGYLGVDMNETNALLGGTSPGSRNVISGFETGVGSYGQLKTVEGNFIGTDITGTKAVGNDIGLGSHSTGVNNVISGNKIGVKSVAGLFLGPNLIGLAANGKSALPNGIGIEAIAVKGISSVGFGEDCTTDPCGVISGNTSAGIQIDANNYPGPVETTVLRGVYIGTDESGTRAVPNGMGIDVTTDPGTPLDLGGPSTALKAGGCTYPCNVIAGNTGPGILIKFTAGSGNGGHSFIQGSYIGVGANGKPLPNGGPGIDIIGPPNANRMLIGGDTAKGNILAAGASPAVTVAGLTPAADTPPVALLTNRYQNQTGPPITRPAPPSPPIISDTISAGTVTITGSTNVPSDPVGPGETVELYASATCGGTRQPVGIAIPATITGNFTLTIPAAALRTTPYLTALRTDDNGTTSRFPPTCQHI